MHFPELRPEFRGTQLPETVVHLTGPRSAIARPVREFLELTYPTADVVDCLRAVAQGCPARPLVLKGDRGRGKSHLMAVIHHAIEHPAEVEAWAESWARNANIQGLAGLKLTTGFKAITRAINDNDDGMFLWEVLFNHHKYGAFAKVQYEGKKQDAPQPSQRIYEEMFTAGPTCLILDEFQTWYEGLPERHGERLPKNWAFNAIQLLSQIAEQHPEKLMLVVSVRTNNSEAFAQLQRVNPQLVDFGGPSSLEDRRRLLLHRLFTNRGVFTPSQIADQVRAYADERIRLGFGQLSGPDEQSKRDEVVACWPFSPELIDLLEKQILLSQNAQETREAIKILAALCRVRQDGNPLLTPADFHVDGDNDSARSLLTSIAQGEQEKLGEIAAANLRKVIESGESVPNARAIISSIWVRSLGSTNQIGGTRRQLQLDTTKIAAIDDNAFRAEMGRLVDHSVNIHADDKAEEQRRLRIGADENPQTKVKAWARNDREWTSGGHYPSLDVEHLRLTISHLLQPESRELNAQVIVLGPQWRTNPWLDVPDTRQHPSNWDRPAVIVLPDPPEIHGASTDAVLGVWLKEHVPKHRNWVRFLLPPPSIQPAAGLFADVELRQIARCSYLTSKRCWGITEPAFFDQHAGFDKTLRDRLRLRFARVSCLHRWSFDRPETCGFVSDLIAGEAVRTHGDVISAAEAIATENGFDTLVFQQVATTMAGQSKTVGDLLRDLEDPAVTGDCLPFFGIKHVQERLIDLVVANVIAIRSGGTWNRAIPGEDAGESKRRLSQALYRTGSEQRSMQLGLPGKIPTAGPMPEPQPTPAPDIISLPTPPIGGPQPPAVPPGGPQTPPSPVPPPGQPAGQRTESRRSPPASKTNLLSWIEQQRDIPAGAPLEASLRLTGVSVIELRKLLQSLPVSVQPSVEVQWTADGQGGRA
ncbi:MAG: hypothetical protein H0X38_01710 [Planctomycetes bacterium]|nr:hypothetical protein [Planctomycetota bacterium]